MRDYGQRVSDPLPPDSSQPVAGDEIMGVVAVYAIRMTGRTRVDFRQLLATMVHSLHFEGRMSIWFLEFRADVLKANPKTDE
jgi:hypothetical protein